SQGDGVPGQGSSGAAGLRRLPGGALAAPADDQRDRERVRDGAVADGKDQGVRDACGVSDDGVQADAIGLAGLASAQRLGAAGGGDQGDRVRGWDKERGRRLTNSSSTTIDNTPFSPWPPMVSGSVQPLPCRRRRCTLRASAWPSGRSAL